MCKSHKGSEHEKNTIMNHKNTCNSHSSVAFETKRGQNISLLENDANMCLCVCVLGWFRQFEDFFVCTDR